MWFRTLPWLYFTINSGAILRVLKYGTMGLDKKLYDGEYSWHGALLRSTPASITTPCPLKAYGKECRILLYFEITNRDFKTLNSTALS